MDVFISIVGIVLTGCLFIFIGRVVDVALERSYTPDLVMGTAFASILVAGFVDGFLGLPLWALIPSIVVGTVLLVTLIIGVVYLIRNGARHGTELADRLGMRVREFLRDRREDRDDRY